MDVSDLNEKTLEGIPVHYTEPAARATSNQQNLGMALMWVEPGQVVERNVDLPKKVETDKEKAIRLQAEIAQIGQAIKEVERQGGDLVRKKKELEERQRLLRVQLREVWTEPLDFGKI